MGRVSGPLQDPRQVAHKGIRVYPILVVGATIRWWRRRWRSTVSSSTSPRVWITSIASARGPPISVWGVAVVVPAIVVVVVIVTTVLTIIIVMVAVIITVMIPSVIVVMISPFIVSGLFVTAVAVVAFVSSVWFILVYMTGLTTANLIPSLLYLGVLRFHLI